MELNSSRYDDSSVPYIGTRQYALNKHVAKWLVGDHNRTQYITILGFLLGRKKSGTCVLGRVKWYMSDRNCGHSGLLKYDAVNYFILFYLRYFGGAC